jgi:hypothetical protein
MIPQLLNFLPYIGTVLSIGITLGALFIALRGGYSKAAGEIQERVISALKQEVEVLNKRVEEMEKDRDRQDHILSTIRYALKKEGLRIAIDGDYVTISQASSKSSKITRIQDRKAQLDNDETDVN